MVVLVIASQLIVGALNLAGKLLTGEQNTPEAQTPTQSAPTTSNTPSVSPTVILACDLESIEVKIDVADGSQFTVEQTVVITATIRNRGTTTCRRDVGSQSNEIYVENADSKLVWSSDRCALTKDKALVNMVPGSKYRIRLEWNGTSNPTQCDRQGSHVPAGDYSVFARNGNAISEPLVISFT